MLYSVDFPTFGRPIVTTLGSLDIEITVDLTNMGKSEFFFVTSLFIGLSLNSRVQNLNLFKTILIFICTVGYRLIKYTLHIYRLSTFSGIALLYFHHKNTSHFFSKQFDDYL